MKKGLIPVFFILGITVSIAFLGIIREIRLNACDNQSLVGLILSVWLFAIIFGNLILGKIVNGRNVLKILRIVLFVIPFLFLFQLALIEFEPILLFGYPWSLNIFYTLLYLLLAFTPLGFCLGLTFAAATKATCSQNEKSTSFIGRIVHWLKAKFFPRPWQSIVLDLSECFIYYLAGAVSGNFIYVVILSGSSIFCLVVFVFLAALISVLFLTEYRSSRRLMVILIVIVFCGWLISFTDFGGRINQHFTSAGSSNLFFQLLPNFEVIGSNSNFLAINFVKLLFVSSLLFLMFFYLLDNLVKKKEKILTVVTFIPEFSLMAIAVIIYMSAIFTLRLDIALGVIFATTFFGLACGNTLARWQLAKNKIQYHSLIRLFFANTLYLVALCLLAAAFKLSLFQPIFAYPILFLAGVFVGMKFPVINQLYLNYHHSQIKSINTIYGHDLIGQALAPIFVIVFLLPTFGFVQVFIFLALINFFAFVALFFFRQYFEEC